MKKFLFVVAAVCLLMCLLASCGSQTTLEKLHTVEKGWTREQVEGLLGEPERELGFSSCLAFEYAIDDTTTAIVYYDGNHLDECFRIQLKNTETDEYTEILK